MDMRYGVQEIIIFGFQWLLRSVAVHSVAGYMTCSYTQVKAPSTHLGAA